MHKNKPTIIEVPYHRPSITGNETKYLNEVFKSGWLTSGKFCEKLEEEFCRIVGVKHALAVNSCTSALHLSVEAIGIKPGDKVFVPTMTFAATAEILEYVGAVPVFLDCDFGTCNITPEILTEGISQNPDIRHLLLVHFGGNPCQMFKTGNRDGIVDICRNNNIKIIEDAAHAFPTFAQNKYVGNIGDFTCFSFYANKTITTGEGGMLTTNNDKVIPYLKEKRLHGIKRIPGNGTNWEYDINRNGYKYNLSDINAAIGLAQLEKFSELHKKRVKIAGYYFDKLKNIEQLSLPKLECDISHHAWHVFNVVLLKNQKITRSELISKLLEKGIRTSVHYKPLHRMTHFRKEYVFKKNQFPNADRYWQGTLSLPLFPDMTSRQCRHVVESLKDLLK